MVEPGLERSVYLDTSVLLAWLTGEARASEELDGLHECMRRISKNHLTAVTSVITDTEILDGNMTPEVQAKFRRFMRRGNVDLIDFELRIRQLSKEIREHYQREKQAGRQRGVVATADAIHLATAINRKVDAFYTFDRGGKDKVSLLAMDGDVAGYNLRIRRPPASQLSLRWMP